MQNANIQPNPEEAEAARAGAFAVDARAATLARGREAVDLAIGEALLRLDESGGFAALGYSGIADYARDDLGLPPRTAFFYVEVARGTRDRPFLREAVVSGFVSLRKALAILPVAVREHEAAWVRLARTATLRARHGIIATFGRPPHPGPRRRSSSETGSGKVYSSSLLAGRARRGPRCLSAYSVTGP